MEGLLEPVHVAKDEKTPPFLEHVGKTFQCNCSNFKEILQLKRESRKCVAGRKNTKLFVRSFGVYISERDPETGAVTKWRKCVGFSIWR
jgi:hypothetical protein